MFEAQGYPIGPHKERSYVLHDLTPFDDTDKEFSLYFSSGVSHDYGGPVGSLLRVRTQNKAEANISHKVYIATITWEDGRINQVDYETPDGLQTITTSIGYDPGTKRVTSLSMAGSPDVSPGDASVFLSSSETLDYGSGINLTRSQSAEAGESRTVTIEQYAPSTGRWTMRTALNEGNRPTQHTLTVNGDDAVTQIEYVNTTGRYGNGRPKQSQVARMVYPNGHDVTYGGFDPDTGWPGWQDSESAPGLRQVLYDYSIHAGEAENPTNHVARPSTSTFVVDGIVVAEHYNAYYGPTETGFQQSCTPEPGW
ncbi:MAG: hypothetical protein AAF492_08785, partial [Verrucomicrobiota bacterium]